MEIFQYDHFDSVPRPIGDTQKGRIEVFLPRTADGVSLRESWAYMW